MLITGVVVALLGTETRSGDFEVADAIFAGVPEETEEAKQSKMDVDEVKEDQWVAMVSGLEIDATPFGSQNQESNLTDSQGEDLNMFGTSEKELRLTMLSEWLQGEVGSPEVSLDDSPKHAFRRLHSRKGPGDGVKGNEPCHRRQ